MAFPSWKLIDENSYRQDFYLFGSRWLNGYGKMKINHRSFNLSRKSPASKPQRRKRWVKGTDNYQANQNVFYTVKQVQQQSGGESLPDFSVPVLPRTAQEWKLGADLILYRFLGYSLVQRSLYGPEEYGRGIFLLRRISNRF